MAKTMESSSPATQKPRTNGTPLSREAIALRAYQLYLERGAMPGNELQDWVQAETQLTGEHGKPHRKTTVKSATA
jgi:hypothetical protein